MLVLTRRAGQSIMIGDGIEVRVVEIRGDQVRLGIVAPDAIAVHRLEVYQQISAANRQAADARAGDDNLQQLGQMIRKLKPE